MVKPYIPYPFWEYAEDFNFRIVGHKDAVFEATYLLTQPDVFARMYRQPNVRGGEPALLAGAAFLPNRPAQLAGAKFPLSPRPANLVGMLPYRFGVATSKQSKKGSTQSPSARTFTDRIAQKVVEIEKPGLGARIGRRTVETTVATVPDRDPVRALLMRDIPPFRKEIPASGVNFRGIPGTYITDGNLSALNPMQYMQRLSALVPSVVVSINRTAKHGYSNNRKYPGEPYSVTEKLYPVAYQAAHFKAGKELIHRDYASAQWQGEVYFTDQFGEDKYSPDFCAEDTAFCTVVRVELEPQFIEDEMALVAANPEVKRANPAEAFHPVLKTLRIEKVTALQSLCKTLSVDGVRDLARQVRRPSGFGMLDAVVSIPTGSLHSDEVLALLRAAGEAPDDALARFLASPEACLANGCHFAALAVSFVESWQENMTPFLPSGLATLARAAEVRSYNIPPVTQNAETLMAFKGFRRVLVAMRQYQAAGQYPKLTSLRARYQFPDSPEGTREQEAWMNSLAIFALSSYKSLVDMAMDFGVPESFVLWGHVHSKESMLEYWGTYGPFVAPVGFFAPNGEITEASRDTYTQVQSLRSNKDVQHAEAMYRTRRASIDLSEGLAHAEVDERLANTQVAARHADVL